MKGTLISSDFIKDSTGKYKFIELNTDAGISTKFINNYLDLNPFINFISESSPQINTVEVVYKPHISTNFVNHLSQSLHESASFVTSFVTHEEDMNTIYPTLPDDSDSKFILRLAYDESAILDSTYAKRSLEPLKLFYDNNSTSSVGFYYASDDYDGGSLEINCLNKSTNSNNLPDLVAKSNEITAKSVSFLKLNSGSTDEERVNLFLSESNDTIISNFIIDSEVESSGVVQSLKSFSIVYGASLDTIPLGMYSEQARFALPTSSIELLDSTDYQYVDNISNKHFHQFSTSVLKERNFKHGLYETENVVSMSGELVDIFNIETGSIMKSYHIDGLPDSDNISVYRKWSMEGHEFGTESYSTSSIVTDIHVAELQRHDLIQLKLEGDDEYTYMSPHLDVLVYNSSSNETSFVESSRINANYHYFINESGSLISVAETNQIILDTPTGSVYTIDVEPADLVYTAGNTIGGISSLGSSFVYHNYSCFAAGTQISLANDDTKNIEDIVIGDSVLAWNGSSFEPAEVISINHENTVGSNVEACKKLGDVPSLYTINETGIAFTPEHPFLTREGWKSLVPNINHEPFKTQQEPKVLKVGDEINVRGEWELINDIQVLRSNAEEKIYNITVKDLHSYVADGIVVHNKAF